MLNVWWRSIHYLCLCDCLRFGAAMARSGLEFMTSQLHLMNITLSITSNQISQHTGLPCLPDQSIHYPPHPTQIRQPSEQRSMSPITNMQILWETKLLYIMRIFKVLKMQVSEMIALSGGITPEWQKWYWSNLNSKMCLLVTKKNSKFQLICLWLNSSFHLKQKYLAIFYSSRCLPTE